MPTMLAILGRSRLTTWSLAGSALPANPKIGVIDIDNTLSSTPAGKRANDAFEKTRKAKQAELDKQQQDLKRAEQDGECVAVPGQMLLFPQQRLPHLPGRRIGIKGPIGPVDAGEDRLEIVILGL